MTGQSTSTSTNTRTDGPATAAPENRSVVLVTLDTTRADHIGCYGRASAATPTLDSLAARGVRFTEARSCVPITLPSHTTIHTGTLPPRHGIHDNAAGTLAARAVTLAEIFHEAGRSTGAFVASFVLNAQYGLGQGFDVYDDVPDRQLVSGGFLQERRAGEVIDAALAWLAGQGKRPVFLWVHLFDAHAPYDPPAPFAERFAGRRYDGEIAYADQQLGRLIDALEKRDGLKGTVVAVTADHGEGLGEHQEASHALFVYDTTLHVPLIVAGANVPHGRIVETAVSLVDLAPTLLEMGGLSIPESMQGRSLARALRPEETGPLEASPTYFESYNGYLNFGWSPLVGRLQGHLKLIDAPRPELYDLREDPHEKRNLFASRSDEAQGMRKTARRLVRLLAQAPTLADEHRPSPLEQSRLEALGYVGARASRGGTLPLPSPELPDPKDKISVQKRRVAVLDLLQNHRLAEAETLARETLLEDPENTYLHEYLGTALAMQGRYEEAEGPLVRCLAHRPDRLEARFTLAFSLYKLGRTEDALAEARECLRHAPGWVKAVRWIAQVETQRGNLDVARSYWRQVVENWKGDPAIVGEARRAISEIDRRLAEKR